jgi:hypothetical protein
MAQVESIGPIKIAMKIRRDAIALAAEALSKMFDKGEEELVAQVRYWLPGEGLLFCW